MPDDFDTFDKAYRFARDRVVAAYLQARAAERPHIGFDAEAMLRSCEINVVATIRNNPAIVFDVVMPPYSILLWRSEYERDPLRFEQILRFSGPSDRAVEQPSQCARLRLP